MRLLYVTEQVPTRDPVFGNGSSLIPYEVIRALPTDVVITLLSFEEGLSVPAEIIDRCTDIVLLAKRTVRHGGVGTMQEVVSPLSTGARERATREARTTVGRLSAAHDLTLLHGSHIATLAHSVTGPVILQVIDPWSMTVGMEAKLTSGWRSVYRLVKARQARRLEERLPRRARLLTVSSTDARQWSHQIHREVGVVANGTHPSPGRKSRPADPTVCFVGSLNYLPNVESATVLIRDIAPRVWERDPAVRFVLAGRQPGPAIRALAGSRVTVMADVPSIEDVLHGAHVAAFPDTQGVGVRNSVQEALAVGVTVVATSAAARGQEPDDLLTIVDDRAAFADAVLARLDARNGSRPGDGTRRHMRDWHDVATDYVAEFAQTARGSGSARDTA